MAWDRNNQRKLNSSLENKLLSSLSPYHFWRMRETAWGSKEWESWPCPLLAAAHRRIGPVPHLGIIVELTALAGIKVNQPWGCENRRADPTSLSCHVVSGWGKEAPPCHLWQVGDLVWRPWKWESWPCPSPTTALRRAGPVPHLSKIVELALVVWVQVSWPCSWLSAALGEVARSALECSPW